MSSAVPVDKCLSNNKLSCNLCDRKNILPRKKRKNHETNINFRIVDFKTPNTGQKLDTVNLTAKTAEQGCS